MSNADGKEDVHSYIRSEIHIYMIVRNFSEYKNEIEEHKETGEDIWVGICSGQKDDYSSYIKNEHDNICLTTTRYLNYVSSLNIEDIIEPRCKYLYYWLYYDYFQGTEDVEKTYKLYNIFFVISSPYNDSIDEKHNRKINEDVLKKFKSLDDMYVNLNKIQEGNAVSQGSAICKCATDCANEYMKYESTCSTQNEDNFCDVIENIRERYNKLIKTVNNCNDAKEWLPSFKPTNLILTILINVVTALVILFVLLILYKFTAFGSRIRSELRRKNKIGHNLHENTNHVLQSPKTYNMNSDNRQYHIAYSS